MNWPAYPTYEETGVEWLGGIPSGWRKSRLKYFTSTIPGGTPDTDNPSYWSEDDEGIPWVSIGDMSRRDQIRTTGKSISAMGRQAKGLQIGVPGTVLFAMYASVGEVSVLCMRAAWNQALLGFKVDERLCRSQFLFYSLKTVRSRLPSLYRSNTQNNLNAEQVENLALALPELYEQDLIVDFLDGETAKVDGLIAKQAQLIATLREDRTATITHAVTKGLDPDVEMKDSGLPWVGSAPSTWRVEKVSRIFRANKSPNAATLTKEYCADFPGDYPVYSGQTADGGILARVDFYEFDFGETGALLSTTVGAKAMSISHIFGRFNLSQNCMIIRSTSVVDMKFFYYHFQSLFAYERQLVSSHMQASFRMEDLYGFRILQPPLSHQRRIAKYLDEQCRRIDELIAKANEVIDMLREYRSALITDAVTGKIDVRAVA